MPQGSHPQYRMFTCVLKAAGAIARTNDHVLTALSDDLALPKIRFSRDRWPILANPLKINKLRWFTDIYVLAEYKALIERFNSSILAK